jgi:lipid-binding SYLF domain-containing protein
MSRLGARYINMCRLRCGLYRGCVFFIVLNGCVLMQRVLKSTLVLLFLSMPFQSALADTYSDAIASFRSAGPSAVYLEQGYGYAIFPTIGKGGIGIGGAHGKGRVYARGAHIGNSSMTQITIGFQLGGQAFSQIVFFEDERALNEFTSGNFEFSAQATAVALTAGVSAEANTGGGTSAGISGGTNNATTVNSGYRKGMAIFTIAKGGLMYEAALGGQKYTYDALK